MNRNARLLQNYGSRSRSSSNSENMVDYGYDWDAVPNVLLYIDNSNIFESAKKYSGHKKGYRNGIPDVACRIDIGKLISKAVGNRRLLFGKLYGSEPPALDTVWEAIRRKQVQVETFQRSKWTLKEKECDASLTADAVEDIIVEKDRAGENRTLVLFSGDRDLFRVVDKAIKFGYRVEIWSFKSAINKTVIRLAQDIPEKVVIYNIDDIFDEITYTKIVWGDKKIPRERSLVAYVRLPPDCDKRQMLKTFVAKAGNIFQLPMMGKYLDNYQYILLVPCIKEHYTPPACRSKSKSEQATVRMYDFYTHIQPWTHLLQEHFQSICAEIITWNEFLFSRKVSDDPEILSSTRFQLLQASENDDDDQEDLESGVHTLSDADSEDSDCIDFFDAHHENISDADDDFIPLVRKVTKARRNIYSDMCIHKFWCTNGLNCQYKHTEQQREFFKIHTNTKLRKYYKIRACYHNVCPYKDKPYLCPYAHNLAESRCLCCGGKGNGCHWMYECPLNTQMNQNNKH